MCLGCGAMPLPSPSGNGNDGVPERDTGAGANRAAPTARTMLEAVIDDDLARWRECRDCGLFQRLPEVPEGEAAVCARCDAMLRRVAPDSVLFARLNAVASAILIALALTLPLVELHVLGRTAQSTIFSGPHFLREQGLAALELVVLGMVVFMPVAKVVVELTVLFGMGGKHRPPWLAWLFGWLAHMSPWAMIEVFLLGGVVAYTRLEALATVHVGFAAAALGGAMLTTVAIDATLDREAIWRALSERAPDAPRARRSARNRFRTARPRRGSSAVTSVASSRTPRRASVVRAAITAWRSAAAASAASGRSSSRRRSSTSRPTCCP